MNLWGIDESGNSIGCYKDSGNGKDNCRELHDKMLWDNFILNRVSLLHFIAWSLFGNPMLLGDDPVVFISEYQRRMHHHVYGFLGYSSC